jgi:hypothetical protein
VALLRDQELQQKLESEIERKATEEENMNSAELFFFGTILMFDL